MNSKKGMFLLISTLILLIISTFAAQYRTPHVLAGIAVSLIVAGSVLMLPETDVRNTVGGRHAPTPSPGAFDARRIRLAPIPCVMGYLLMVPAILYVPPTVKNDRMESEK